MTDTMSARQQIGTIVHAARDVLFIDEATDHIIDIVREALLSEPAVTAAMTVIEYRSQEPLAAQDWKKERDDWKEAVTAALDAAFGDQQP